MSFTRWLPELHSKETSAVNLWAPEALGDLVGAHGHHSVAETGVVAQLVRVELLLGRGDDRRRILR